MNFNKVADTSELGAGEKKKISLAGKEILLINIQGFYYAVDNACPHMGGSLFEGDLEGNHIKCPKHGSIFDVTTGKVVTPGKLLFMKVKVHDLKSYPIKIEGTDLLLALD